MQLQQVLVAPRCSEEDVQEEKDGILIRGTALTQSVGVKLQGASEKFTANKGGNGKCAPNLHITTILTPQTKKHVDSMAFDQMASSKLYGEN